MPKVSHGSARHGAAKKKVRRRVEPQVETALPQSQPEVQPAQPQEIDRGNGASGETAIRFRPRSGEARTPRTASGRLAATARVAQQTMDYGYVYTDLKIIGGLSVFLFGGLGALYLVLR